MLDFDAKTITFQNTRRPPSQRPDPTRSSSRRAAAAGS
jgi:hypothetical protein